MITICGESSSNTLSTITSVALISAWRRIVLTRDQSKRLNLGQLVQNQWLVDYIIDIFGKLPDLRSSIGLDPFAWVFLSKLEVDSRLAILSLIRAAISFLRTPVFWLHLVALTIDFRWDGIFRRDYYHECLLIEGARVKIMLNQDNDKYSTLSSHPFPGRTHFPPWKLL